MNATDAAIFGFASRTGLREQGDGNGIIEGEWGGNTPRMVILAGEAELFWVDLSQAGLIEGYFNYPEATTPLSCGGCIITANSTPASQNLNTYVPPAKIGQGNYIYVYSNIFGCSPCKNMGMNYFGLINIASVDGHGDLTATPTLTLTVRQAYDIDAKVDDGLPQTGRVTAQFVEGSTVAWASGSASGGIYGAAPGAVAAPSSTSCYDNGGNTSNPMQYSIAQNNGSGSNCALSFQFQ